MKDDIIAILHGILGKEAADAGIPVELSVPDEPAFGHFSTNVAMRLAKPKGVTPMALAEDIAREAARRAPEGLFEKVEPAAPGFVNFWMSPRAVQQAFARIAEEDSGRRFGRGNARAGATVLVEFTDPNPFKEFHIGHLMSNAIGESMARLIEFQGAEVKRLSYGGDVGLHVAKAMFGALQKRNDIPGVREESESAQLAFWAAAYVDGSARYEEDPRAREEIDVLNRTIFDHADPEIEALYAWGREVSIAKFKELFLRLDTDFVRNYWESEVVEDGLKAVEEGIAKGILEHSEGAVVFKGESYGLHTRVFVNSRGVPTYEAKELGLTMRKRRDFAFDASIVLTGNEQNDYFKVLLKVVDLLIPDLAGKTTHVSHGMLRFASGKMSSRKGNVITAEALLAQVSERLRGKVSERSMLTDADRDKATEAIALGAVRYSILKQNPGQDIVFDFEKSLSFDGDAGPYLQYAYARLRSVHRKAEEAGAGEVSATSDAALEGLQAFIATDAELALVRRLAEFPDVAARAAERLAPSGLAAYCYRLAVAANKFYETTPILKDEDAMRREARLRLVEAAANVLASGLRLLGIQALERI